MARKMYRHISLSFKLLGNLLNSLALRTDADENFELDVDDHLYTDKSNWSLSIK